MTRMCTMDSELTMSLGYFDSRAKPSDCSTAKSNVRILRRSVTSLLWRVLALSIMLRRRHTLGSNGGQHSLRVGILLSTELSPTHNFKSIIKSRFYASFVRSEGLTGLPRHTYERSFPRNWEIKSSIGRRASSWMAQLLSMIELVTLQCHRILRIASGGLVSPRARMRSTSRMRAPMG